MNKQLSKTKIHISNDYNSFKIRKTNRPVSDQYVESLVESIRKHDLTHNFPIVVTENMEIIDGQHRYFACMELGLPIKYTIVDGDFKSREIDDVTVLLNTNQRAWRLNEFVNLYSRRGVAAYKMVQEIMERYSLNVSNAIVIVSNGLAKSVAVREGKLEVGRIDPHIISRALIHIRQIFPDAMHNKFVSAFTSIMVHNLYNPDTDFHRLQLYRMDMTKCATVEQYIRMLEVILNKRRRGGKVDFSIAEPKTAMEG